MRRVLPLLAASAIALAAGRADADVRVFSQKDDDGYEKTFDLYGWIQPRFSWQQSDKRPEVNFDPNPAFTVNRTRIGGIVNVKQWLRGQFELEVARDVTYSMDAYLTIAPIPEVQLTAGQFRVPFSRQNLLPSKAFQLPDVAYFVSPKFLVDRDIGAQLSGDLFEKRLRYFAGMFNGNDPARGMTQNLDPYFLFAGRIEAAPLGAAPRFEGDMRPIPERDKPLVAVGLSAMHTRSDDKHFSRTWLGADLGAWWKGASLYAELFGHRDASIDPAQDTCSQGTGGWIFKDDTKPGQVCVTQVGWNVQGGYFPPLPYAEDHIEVVARVERFDPAREVSQPKGDSGSRELDQANPTWGYMGFIFGVNWFAERTNDWKVQTSYEVRNETKSCLEGQGVPGHPCTGAIKNNLFLVQATGAF